MTAQPKTVILPWLAGWLPGEGATTLEAEITARISDINLCIAASEAEARERIRRATIVITNALPADLLDDAAELEWVQTVGVGVDSYPLEALATAGVTVTNAAGVSAEPVAEQVLGYLTVFERRIHRGIRQQYDARWERYHGGELAGKTLGIIGLGAIGERVAEFGQTLDMTVLGCKRRPDTDHPFVDELVGPTALHEILPRVDYLVVACPLTDQTRGLLGKREFVAMPSSSVLINVARGAIVDETALTRAIQNNRIRGAALDVFHEEPLPADSPLWGQSNVIITPHMAGSTPAYWSRLAEIFTTNYHHFTAGEPGKLINKVALHD